MSETTVDALKTFTNKQVLSLLGACAFIVFSGSGIYYRFQDMESKTFFLETQVETEIQMIRDEMKLGFEFMQDQRNGDKDGSRTRTNTIRDRTDLRLDKLEESNSDKK